MYTVLEVTWHLRKTGKLSLGIRLGASRIMSFKPPLVSMPSCSSTRIGTKDYGIIDDFPAVSTIEAAVSTGGKDSNWESEMANLRLHSYTQTGISWAGCGI